METVGKIRRWYRVEGRSISEIAKRLGASRNTVKKYLRSGVVMPRYKPRPKRAPVIGAWADRLQEWLAFDEQRPRKERRTAQRMFELLRAEGYGGSYVTVQRFVRAWRSARAGGGRTITTAFIPLAFGPGEAYQFDFSQETVELAGRVTAVKVAHTKLSFSRVFHATAYLREAQEMVFDAHARAFRFFGGVARRGIYDNMKAAVQTIFAGKSRQYNRHFLRMTSHYLIEPVACTPAAGWEKGQVEHQVGLAREQIFTPRLRAASLRELNELLQRRCEQVARQLTHPERAGQSRWEVFEAQERGALMPLPPPFDGFTEREVRVTATALVHFERNRYSVDGRWAGKTVALRAYADRIVAVAGATVVAEHERCFERERTIFNPWHYVEALQTKPGALRNGAPFRDWKLPEPVEQVRQRLLARAGGDRQFVTILNAARTDGLEAATVACELALEAGVVTAEFILNALSRLKPGSPLEAVPEPRTVTLREAPKADVARYDRLLKKLAVASLLALPAAVLPTVVAEASHAAA